MYASVPKCKTCKAVAHIIEGRDFYCAPCIIKRDNIPERRKRLEKNKKKTCLTSRSE